jgi:hypothetical protein
MMIFDKIERDDDKVGSLKWTLNFKIVFEEIWDFYLKFRDWRTTNLAYPRRSPLEGNKIKPWLHIKLDSTDCLQG